MALWARFDCSVMKGRWPQLDELVRKIVETGDAQDVRMTRTWACALNLYGAAPMSQLVELADDLLVHTRSARLRNMWELTQGLALAAQGTRREFAASTSSALCSRRLYRPPTTSTGTSCWRWRA